VGKDRFLERYWRHHLAGSCAEALAQLDLSVAVTPNFSMFLDDPRPQHLHNRRRILITGEGWSREGVPAAVSLQALTDADWRYWEDFLTLRPDVRLVALEFQTGLSRPTWGRRALEHLSSIQNRIGRSLHLIAAGGMGFVPTLRQHFDTWTVVDSTPFLKAAKRRAAFFDRGRLRWRLEDGPTFDALLEHNLQVRLSQAHRTGSADSDAGEPREILPTPFAHGAASAGDAHAA
jgi:hypothetical protein